jgi:two-component system sensor histidine kinase KdpD
MTVVPIDRELFYDPNQLHLLDAFCDQTAAAVERVQSSAAARDAEIEIKTERMRNSLLSAVSHDIKTPLSSIYGAATSLLEEEERLRPSDRRELIESIAEDSMDFTN